MAALKHHISQKESNLKIDARKQLEEKCIKVKQKIVENEGDPIDEYLIQWSGDFISPLADTLQEYDVDEISRKDLTIPEGEVSAVGDILNKNLEHLKNNKVKNIEQEREIYWTSIIAATGICEDIYADGRYFLHPAAIENKMAKLNSERKY